jgi:hypothetical protein
MTNRNFLYEAFLNAGEKLVNDALRQSAKELNDAIREAMPAMGSLRYSAFTEYGKPPIVGDVVDSTATVIDDDVKALPEPKEGEL